MKDWQWVLMVMVGLMIVGGFFFFNPLKTQEVTTGDGPIVTCDSSTTCAVTFNVVDKYSPASAQSTWVNYRKIGTTAWTAIASGSSADFAPGDKIEILADHNGTVGYGSHVKVWEVPCKTSASFEATTADFNTANITGTYWNAAGTASTAQAMGAGDIKNVKFQFTGNYQYDLGNTEIGYNVINCIANTSEIKDLVISGLTAESKPSMIASTAGFDDYTWRFPIIESNVDTPVYTASITADDTVNPTDDIVCTVYDTNYDIDADTGAVIQGVQDEDKNNLGIQEPAVMARVTLDLS